MAAEDLITLTQARRALGERGGARRPWDYPVAVALPHYETPETLPVLLELLQLQTVRPYILLLDTGSSPQTVRVLEKLRRPTIEVHYLRPHGFRHTSAPVTTAMDAAFALCRQQYLFCTHTDVFPRRRDLLEWLLSLCRADQPVVGYEMSPRSWASNRWRNVVSHGCTMLHMPTMRQHGIAWSFERYWESGQAEPQQNGYPDTEQPFDRCLRKAGIYPYLIGHEPNDYYKDENIEHVRSWTGLKRLMPNDPRTAQRYSQLHWALFAARQRIQQWKQEDGR
jgi:hypothetical protein